MITPGALLDIVFTLLDLIGLTTCIGVLFYLVRILPAGRAPGTFTRPAWHLLAICLGILTLSSLGILTERTMLMSGSPLQAVPALLPLVLLKTHFGTVWLIRAGALLWLWIAWTAGRRTQGRLMAVLMLIGTLVLAVSRSVSSHAADQGDFTLPELMNWMHLVSVSVWGGTLLAMSVAFFPSLGPNALFSRAELADLARRLSGTATVALIVVLITGVYNAWIEVHGIRPLWESTYGRLLLFKLALTLVMIILGASNRLRHVPRMRLWAEQAPDAGHDRDVSAATPWHRLQRTIDAESVLMLMILTVTAFLLHAMPPRDAASMQHTGTPMQQMNP